MRYTELVELAKKHSFDVRDNGSPIPGQDLWETLADYNIVPMQFKNKDYHEIQIGDLGFYESDEGKEIVAGVTVTPVFDPKIMTSSKVLGLIDMLTKQQITPGMPEVKIHLTNGFVVPIKSIGTDGAGIIYLQADCEGYYIEQRSPKRGFL